MRDHGSPGALEERLGHRFRSPEHLRRALTHSSHAHDSGSAADNEALEFYGDALLGFLIVEALCARHPGMDEGRLSKMKAYLVSGDSLARIARRIDLGAYLRLGRGAGGEAVEATDSILADALEAVLAAVHLDGGDAAARRVVRTLFGDAVEHLEPQDAAHQDPKTALQERLQADGRPVPVYRVGRTEGPPHRPVFHVDLLIDGEVAARAEGGSKKEAEQSAARQALRVIAEEAPPPRAKRAKPRPKPAARPASPKRPA
jgi:ribonuclease-3